MFRVDRKPIVVVKPGQIGLVVAKDGDPLPQDRILARRVECGDFQDAEKSLRLGGQKGKQSAVLTAGMYRINLVLFEVPIGHVGVVVSFVGSDEKDISGETFTQGNIVPRGGKGVCSEPLYPGKRPQRSDRRREAREHISRAIFEYDVQSVDSLIEDITPPPVPNGHLDGPQAGRRAEEDL